MPPFVVLFFVSRDGKCFFNIREKNEDDDADPNNFQRKQGERQIDKLLQVLYGQHREQDDAKHQYEFIEFHE
jgi:hypothetical protein